VELVVNEHDAQSVHPQAQLLNGLCSTLCASTPPAQRQHQGQQQQGQQQQVATAELQAAASSGWLRQECVPRASLTLWHPELQLRLDITVTGAHDAIAPTPGWVRWRRVSPRNRGLCMHCVPAACVALP
jgi:hypothetical protein